MALRRTSIACILAMVAVWIGIALPARAQSNDPPTQRLIVKFKDDAAAALPVSARIARLAAEGNVALYPLRPMALGAHLVVLDRAVPLSEARAIAQRLAAHPDVEYAVPDRRMHAQLVPNDPLLASQTYLNNGPAAISAFAAWDITTGSPNTVVAVVDTGYLPHAGLAGRFLAGYDFITDPPTANDGDGRDPDATDPGDWMTLADAHSPAFELQGCSVENSSWHGTAVSSVIAANGNDGVWSAGIDWAAKVLPVRVLGKCGGWFSDIMDGVAWAAGLSVPGVPANPHPAQIINMSLGDSDQGACTPDVQSVISGALAHGVTRAIVVSAGNESDDVASHTPANCSGVISVAATDIDGSLASYSNSGATTTISAPGGGGSGPGDHILVLANRGTATATTDDNEFLIGTSFSAPMVSGVIALMLAVAPNLSAAQIRSLLATSAKPFPVGSSCSTATCGAGIVDAHGAVLAAQSIGGAPLDLNQHGLTGSWFKQATTGQGVEVEVFANPAAGTGSTFVSWFTYDSAVGGADHQRWYTAQGAVVTGQPSAALTIYQNTGGNFDAPPVTSAQAVGTATLSFDTCTSGQLAYNFTDGTGRTGTIALTRLTQNVTCSTTTPHPTNADFALSGNWFGGAMTSGQGLTAEVNPLSGLLFAAWYTYMPNGMTAGAAGQRWYTGQGAFTPGMRSIPVTLYETTGGKFDTPTPPGQQTLPVGTGTMAFQSCSAAMFSYSFTGGTSAGLSGTINLIRVGPVPPGCTS